MIESADRVGKFSHHTWCIAWFRFILRIVPLRVPSYISGAKIRTGNTEINLLKIKLKVQNHGRNENDYVSGLVAKSIAGPEVV